MKKILILLFLCVVNLTFSRDIYDKSYVPNEMFNPVPTYEFKSTSTMLINQELKHTTPLYPIENNNTPFSNQPRKIIRYDDLDEHPDYNPNEPNLPIGDNILPLTILIGIYTIWLIYKNRYFVI